MARQDLINIEITVKSPEGNSRKHLIRATTGRVMVPESLPVCQGASQENFLSLGNGQLEYHINLKALRGCLREFICPFVSWMTNVSSYPVRCDLYSALFNQVLDLSNSLGTRLLSATSADLESE